MESFPLTPNSTLGRKSLKISRKVFIEARWAPTIAGNEPEIRSLRSSSLRIWLRRTGCRGLHVARSLRSGTALQSARFIVGYLSRPGGSQLWYRMNRRSPPVGCGGKGLPPSISRMTPRIWRAPILWRRRPSSARKHRFIMGAGALYRGRASQALPVKRLGDGQCSTRSSFSVSFVPPRGHVLLRPRRSARTDFPSRSGSVD